MSDLDEDGYELSAETVNIGDGKSGIVFANYIPVYNSSTVSYSDLEMTTPAIAHRKYRRFMEKYRKDHAACPKCGATDHSSTYVAYILNLDMAGEYKDLNDCVCSECGDKHTVHERVKKVK